MPTDIIFLVLILIFSVIIHEVSHGYMANYLGDPTARLAGRLTLNPIPHIDLLGSIIVPALMALTPGVGIIGWAKPVPYNPYNLRNQKWGEALVAFAGPGSNLAIALFFSILVRLDMFSPAFESISLVVIYINIVLAVINLIPIPPIDGSKIVSALLPFHLREKYLRLQDYVYALGPMGMILILLLLLYVFGQHLFLLILWVTSLFSGLSAVGVLQALSSFFS